MKHFFEVLLPDGETAVNRIDFNKEIPDYRNAYMPISCNLCQNLASSFYLHPRTKEAVFLCSKCQSMSNRTIKKKILKKK